MFSDEILLDLRELVRRIPLLINVRLGYTRSALRLTVHLPDPNNNEVLILFLFIGLVTSLFILAIGGAQHYISAPGLVGLAVLSGLLLYGILRVNRRVNASQRWPANFIIDAATRRITLPAPGRWWAPTVPGPTCRFEDVARVEARLAWADTGYGEMAEVRLDFTNDYPPQVLHLRSYAVAQQLALVLQRIIQDAAPDAAANTAAEAPDPPAALTE